MAETLERLFGSRIRAKLLGWFFAHTDERFFGRQLAPIIAEDHANLSRELIRLEKLGILFSDRQGNQKHFQANRNCPFFNELRGLVLKTTGVIGQLRAMLESIPGVTWAIVYGSYARGEEKTGSDLDILVVGQVDLDLLDEAIQGMEKESGRTINYVLYDAHEFRSKVEAQDGFITDVLSGDKISLAGKIDAL
jgi:uncharacterized protein